MRYGNMCLLERSKQNKGNTMNKAEAFKKAHKLAKEMVGKVGDYMVAMSIALKKVYAIMKGNVQSKLESLRLSVWGESFGKARIYIDPENMGEVFGLEINLYNTGNISSARLNGEKISNSRAYKMIQNKIYFDIESQIFVGTDLKAII